MQDAIIGAIKGAARGKMKFLVTIAALGNLTTFGICFAAVKLATKPAGDLALTEFQRVEYQCFTMHPDKYEACVAARMDVLRGTWTAKP